MSKEDSELKSKKAEDVSGLREELLIYQFDTK